MDLPETLVWECHYCGLETPEPAAHLRRAHDTTIEAVMEMREERERRERELERLLFLDELNGPFRTPGGSM